MPDLQTELRAKLSERASTPAVTSTVYAELHNERYENETFTSSMMADNIGYTTERERGNVNAALWHLCDRGVIEVIPDTSPKAYIRVRLPELTERARAALHNRNRRSNWSPEPEPPVMSTEPPTLVEPGPNELSTLPLDDEDTVALEQAFDVIRSLCGSRLVDLSTVPFEALEAEYFRQWRDRRAGK